MFFFWGGVKNRDSSESYSPTLSSNCCSSLRFFGLPPNLEGYRSWLACCCSKEGIGMLAPCSHQDHDVFLRVPKLNTIASWETCIPRPKTPIESGVNMPIQMKSKWRYMISPIKAYHNPILFIRYYLIACDMLVPWRVFSTRTRLVVPGFLQLSAGADAIVQKIMSLPFTKVRACRSWHHRNFAMVEIYRWKIVHFFRDFMGIKVMSWNIIYAKNKFFFGTFHSGGGDTWFENPILTQFSKK